MIASITTIMYILSITDESINNGILQKGTAISRIDNENAFQIYKYYNYLTSQNDTDSDLNEDSEITLPLKKENVYLITGKFSTAQDGSINVSIITYIQLFIDKEDIPAMKPTVHFVGKTLNYAELTESGYTLQIQVKPYLSKDQFVPFTVNLTHPSNGRFKNSLTKAKKNSTVHTTGVFFFVESELYCEILDFQFVSAKIESDNSIVVPWKSKTNSHTDGSSKSALEQRIALIQQNSATQPPSSTKPPAKNKRKTNMTKIADISKSLLSQDQHDDEIHNNETSITDEERVEDTEEIDDTPPRISSATRSRKKKKT